jgi:hydrogenase expression/formation protein HypC
MCLAIPGEILTIDDSGELNTARVSFGGLVKEVCLACLPEAKTGDFVLVHAGFAIAVVSAEHAADVRAYLDRIGEET